MDERPPDTSSSVAFAPQELDLRDLEPPEPMLRILSALERMPAGALLVALLGRRPVFLLPRIEAAGHAYALRQRDEQTWELRITKS